MEYSRKVRHLRFSLTQNPATFSFKDINGDGALNATDKTKIGHFLPDFSYGLTYLRTGKGLMLRLFMQGVSGNEIYSVVKYDLEGMTRLFKLEHSLFWIDGHLQIRIRLFLAQFPGDPNKNARGSPDRFIEDGSYFRIKNLTIGYSIPARVFSDLTNNTLTRLRVYFTSQNLLTITDYEGYDPEIGNRNNDDMNAPLSTRLTQGVDYGQFPPSKEFHFRASGWILTAKLNRIPNNMTMNRKFILTTIGLFAICFSCDDSILDKKNPNQFTPDTFYKNDTQIVGAVNAVYASLQSLQLFCREYFFVHDLRSDDMGSGGGQLEPQRAQLLLGNHDPSNSLLRDVWTGWYTRDSPGERRY